MSDAKTSHPKRKLEDSSLSLFIEKEGEGGGRPYRDPKESLQERELGMESNRRNPEPFVSLTNAVAASRARNKDLWVKITGDDSAIKTLCTVFHVYPGGRVVQSAKMVDAQKAKRVHEPAKHPIQPVELVEELRRSLSKDSSTAGSED